MARGDPKRTRTAVRDSSGHIGYLTTVGYPDRDIAAFPEGSPYSEAVVSDLGEQHVALLQQFKAHWLIHCGNSYATTDAGGALTDRQLAALAAFALHHANDTPAVLVAALAAHVEQMLT